MVEIGQTVIYGTSGVCRVEGITEKTFGNSVMSYYVLKSVMQRESTVFVPTDNEKLTQRIHSVFSKEKYERVFKEIKSKKPIHPENEKERQDVFEKIIANGDREMLILMIMHLYKFRELQKECGKRLHIADEKILSAAREMLIGEVSYAYGISADEALELVNLKIG